MSFGSKAILEARWAVNIGSFPWKNSRNLQLEGWAKSVQKVIRKFSFNFSNFVWSG
jgi:hypothetical protein